MSEPMERPCIVQDIHGALELCFDVREDYPRGGVLLHGDVATVFRNRQQARRAIERTVAYATGHHYEWRSWQHRVLNLESQS